MKHRILQIGAAAAAILSAVPLQAENPGQVLAWGYNTYGQTNVPEGLDHVTAVAAGTYHTVALKNDGTVVAWGAINWGPSEVNYGQANVPSGLSGVTAIAAGESHTLALKSNGTVQAWGAGSAAIVPLGLANVVAIAAGGNKSLALKNDGKVMAWGFGNAVPVGLSDVIAISAGRRHALALKSDGKVVSWGENYQGQTEVPEDLGGVVAISAGEYHSVALKNDGTVVAWGADSDVFDFDYVGAFGADSDDYDYTYIDFDYGQADVPEGLNNVVAIAAGGYFTLALKNDGTLVSWGNTSVPSGFGFTSIAAGGSHCLAMLGENYLVVQQAKRGVASDNLFELEFEVRSSGEWTWGKSEGSSWLTSTEDITQSGDQVFTYDVRHNLTEDFDDSPQPRSATITLTSGAGSAVHDITQAGYYKWSYDGRYPVTLHRKVPDAVAATPDKAGVLSVSAKHASKLTKGPGPQTILIPPYDENYLDEIVVKVSATAKKGYLFSHWEGLPTNSYEQNGNAIQFYMPSLSVPHLTAVFIANPFSGSTSKLLFQGVLENPEFTDADNYNVGKITATLATSSGGISGKVWMDGKATSFRGLLTGDGKVWFKEGKHWRGTLRLKDGEWEHKGLSARWSANGLRTKVHLPDTWDLLGEFDFTNESKGLAKPKLASIPAALLPYSKGKKGHFTLALPAKGEQFWYENLSEYPQGTGYAALTLSKAGTLKMAGVLADGTKITASSHLVAGNTSPVFIQLTTPGAKASVKGGSLGGNLAFDASAADSDVGGKDWRWFRPEARTAENKTQAYRAGWPYGITIDPVGALYDSGQTVQQSLGLESTGNASLEFAEGKLPLPSMLTVSNFTILGNKVAKNPANDKSYSLVPSAKTGLFSGSFTPVWNTPLLPAKKLPAFRGVLLQKGGNKGGWGFFLSNAAGDLNPESGAVSLGAP